MLHHRFDSGAVDLAAPIAFLLAVVAVLAADLLDGGTLHALLNVPAMLLVLAGTVGATVMSVDRHDLGAVLGSLRRMLFPRGAPRRSLIADIGALAEVSRREGLLRLEDELGRRDFAPFLALGLRKIADGADENRLRSLLGRAMDVEDQRELTVAHIFRTAGGFAPTLGIIGTVVGLISVLSRLADVQHLAPSIATAFLATFWGIASANLFWLPLGFRLENLERERQEEREMVLEGLIGIANGRNPRLLQEELAVYADAAGGKTGAVPPEAP